MELVHPESAADWADIKDICCETAARPIPQDERAAFGRVWVEPYERWAARWAYVARDRGGIVGYLTGCASSIPFYLRRALSYRPVLSANARFSPGVFARLFLRYPAHLHVNVREGHRGGLGRALVERYEADLRRAGGRGVHLFCGERAAGFYRKVGYEELGRHAVGEKLIFAFGKRLLAALLAAAALCGPASAQLQLPGQEPAPRTRFSIGPRAVWYKPIDADGGAWNPGIQAKFGLSDQYALQLSVDKTHHEAKGEEIRAWPIQGSILGYFTPESPLSFYVLFGGGYYLERLAGPPSRKQTRFNPHVGVGLELLSEGPWEADVSYRYIYSMVYKFWDLEDPWGAGWRRKGAMITGSLSRRF